MSAGVRCAGGRFLAKALCNRERRTWQRTGSFPGEHRPLVRLRHALQDWHQWWSWGRPVMCFVGRGDCGSYSPPEPRSWYWYYDGNTLVVAKTYDQKRAIDESFAGRAAPYWHYLNVQDDGGTLIPGNVYAGGANNYGISREVTRLLVRYIVVEWWIKANWLGLRPWIYYKALHQAVHQRRPFSCQAVPAKGSGGYNHWHCQLNRRHIGAHRYNAYTWALDGVVRFDGVNG